MKPSSLRKLDENLRNFEKSLKMEPGTDCFVSGALATVLRLSRFTGIAPLHFVKKRTGWRVSLSRGLSVYGYIIVTIIILTTTATLIRDLLSEQDKSVRMRNNTRRMVWIVDASLMMVIAGFAVYGAPGQMRSMITYLNHVQKINYELNIHHWPRSLEKIKVGLFIFWVMVTVTLTFVDHMLLTYTIIMINAGTWTSVIYSFYYYCYWIMQLREMLFIMIALHVKYSFKTVNNGLRNLLHGVTAIEDFKILPFMEPFIGNKTYKRSFNNYVNSIADSGKKDSDGITKSTRPQHETVRHLTLVYASVCDVVRQVDCAHGPMVMLMLGSFLLHLVCSPYYLINNLSIYQNVQVYKISRNNTTHIISVLLQLLWVCYHMVNLVMIVEPCHLTHVEMGITRELVSHLMRCTHSIYDPLAVELEIFFRHLILNQVSYSPMQVTTMSRALVATILGSITTYLVVILQL